MIHPLQVGGVTLPNNLLLAPLAGYSDAGLRSLAAEYGAGLTFTEMVSAKGLFYKSENTKTLLYRTPPERLCAVQLFGCDPIIMGKMCHAPELSGFDIIDINMGCPVGKIVKNGEGSALLGNLPLASRVISSCVKESEGRPVTVKMRIGRDAQHINCVEFARMAEESGAAMLSVHGRTAEQAYTGQADYGAIASVVQAVKIPVIANGDIRSASDAERAFCQTGAAGIMIGRGAIGNPAIFSELLGAAVSEGRLQMMRRQLLLLAEYYGERYAVLNMRKHAAFYLKKLTNGRRLKDALNETVALAPALAAIDAFIRENA